MVGGLGTADTFHFNFDSVGKTHLWVVVQIVDVGGVLHGIIANITTIRGTFREDLTCTLEPGCHRFVTDRSWVKYEFMRCEPLDALCDKITATDTRASEDVMEAIRNGVHASKFTPNGIKAHFPAK